MVKQVVAFCGILHRLIGRWSTSNIKKQVVYVTCMKIYADMLSSISIHEYPWCLLSLSTAHLSKHMTPSVQDFVCHPYLKRFDNGIISQDQFMLRHVGIEKTLHKACMSLINWITVSCLSLCVVPNHFVHKEYLAINFDPPNQKHNTSVAFCCKINSLLWRLLPFHPVLYLRLPSRYYKL